MTVVFLAEGFEEIEAVTPVDLLRRAGLTVRTAGVGGKTVRGAHGVPFVCDLEADQVDPEELDLVVLPGGMPGARNLEASAAVRAAVESVARRGKLVGAICAAPSILGHWGLLEGKTFTCYPGFENSAPGGRCTVALCERDGGIITGKGPGAAIPFALALVEALAGAEKAAEVREGLQCE